ncbi:hypothetical protein HDK90DRAFT_490912 [Phyllosticta capitalensis]|uniref:Secreted protein n=1 Tax=Phyllosticta capitalensis TaxID=121624 RepID=A0ABR1YHS0_9PEZI
MGWLWECPPWGLQAKQGCRRLQQILIVSIFFFIFLRATIAERIHSRPPTEAGCHDGVMMGVSHQQQETKHSRVGTYRE